MKKWPVKVLQKSDGDYIKDFEVVNTLLSSICIIYRLTALDGIAIDFLLASEYPLEFVCVGGTHNITLMLSSQQFKPSTMLLIYRIE